LSTPWPSATTCWTSTTSTVWTVSVSPSDAPQSDDRDSWVRGHWSQRKNTIALFAIFLCFYITDNIWSLRLWFWFCRAGIKQLLYVSRDLNICRHWCSFNLNDIPFFLEDVYKGRIIENKYQKEGFLKGPLFLHQLSDLFCDITTESGHLSTSFQSWLTLWCYKL
jgi:hypothetical protein